MATEQVAKSCRKHMQRMDLVGKNTRAIVDCCRCVYIRGALPFCRPPHCAIRNRLPNATYVVVGGRRVSNLPRGEVDRAACARPHTLFGNVPGRSGSGYRGDGGHPPSFRKNFHAKARSSGSRASYSRASCSPSWLTPAVSAGSPVSSPIGFSSTSASACTVLRRGSTSPCKILLRADRLMPTLSAISC